MILDLDAFTRAVADECDDVTARFARDELTGVRRRVRWQPRTRSLPPKTRRAWTKWMP